MKKTLILASTILILVWPARAIADLRFGVAAEPYAPFTFKEPSGDWAGWEIDLMKVICIHLSEKCSVVEVAWEGMIPALNSNKFDVVLASMSITEKRRAVIAFSDVYYKSSAQVLGSKDAAVYKVPADLKDKRIGVQAASIHQAYAEKYFVAAGGQIKTYGKQDDALADLGAGRIDYVLGEALALDAYLQSLAGRCCRIAGTVAFDGKVFGDGVGFGFRQQDTQLPQRVNVALKAVATSGALESLTAKWHLTGKIILPSAP